MSFRDCSFSASRRLFLARTGQSLGSLGLTSSLFNIGEAMAGVGTNVSGYRALVCLYMDGGNDGFNTVVPTDTNGYGAYSRSRRGLALPKSSLLGLSRAAPDGGTYGFHGSCPEMKSLFDAGRLAIISNVGSLVRPTSVEQARIGSVPLPPHLFSHTDQTDAWWSATSDGTEPLGWAGRVADLYSDQGYVSNVAMNVIIGGPNKWQTGGRTFPYTFGIGGAPLLNVLVADGYRQGRRAQATRDLIQQASNGSVLMSREFANLQNNAITKAAFVREKIEQVGPPSTAFPSYAGDGDLGAQLRQVAQLIKAHSAMGEARQMFYVNVSGFDMHNDELVSHQNLLRIVSQNLKTFWDAMTALGEQNNVTVFTASDFGRGLTSNGDGSDHAWGSHHFVIGGAVRGGWYGRMPSLVLDGADDLGAGRIVPTTSIDQYSATLASWFGVADAELDGLMPNLRNFSVRNLGFMF